MRNKFGEVVSKYLKDNKNIYYLTADIGNKKISENIELYKDQVIDLGIAEANMIGVASGLALEGKTVIVNSIGNFSTLRCLEQIRIDVAYHDLNVKICSTGGGFAYGSGGVTHHSTEDLSVMRAIPHMVCFVPATVEEIEVCTQAMLEYKGPCYMRIGNVSLGNVPLLNINHYEIGKALCYKEGTQVAIFSTGSMLEEGYEAAKILNEQGISCACCSFPVIKPMDEELIKKYAKQCDYIITLEENVIEGGFGSAICEIIAEMDETTAVVKRFGLHNDFASIIGDQNYLRKVYHMSTKDIVDWVNKRIR